MLRLASFKSCYAIRCKVINWEVIQFTEITSFLGNIVSWLKMIFITIAIIIYQVKFHNSNIYEKSYIEMIKNVILFLVIL